MSTIQADLRSSARLAGLAADVYGSGDGRPPFVLLHGPTFDPTMWSPALSELEAIDPGRHVIALDLPGHGQSDDLASYRLEDVVDRVHAALEEAGIRFPVLVGHSIAGGIASVYAARYATRGVVNVDADLRVRPFAELIQSLATRIESSEFDDVWRTVFWPSMRMELLPLSAQKLLCGSSCARQGLVVGYWRDLLDRSPEHVEAWVSDGLATLQNRAVPYLVVAGDELDDAYRSWLAEQLPQAIATVLPRSGHFPHVAHPRQFSECLLTFADPPSARSYVR